MTDTNIVLIEAIKKIYGEKTQIYNRFLRMVEFYGHSGTNKLLSDFFKLAINDTDKFKDLERVVRKWRSPHTIKNMYSSLLKIYEIPVVKGLFDSEQYDQVVKEIKDFWKEAEKEAATTTVKRGGDSGGAGSGDGEIVVIDKSQTDLNTFRMRMCMYCDILDEIGGDTQAITAVTKMIRFDIEKI